MGAGWRLAHRPAAHRAEPARVLPDPGDRIRVEVLNGAGVTGLSRAVTERLRDGGVDVVYFGNDSAQVVDSTEILVRQGNADAGARVRRILGTGLVRAAPDPTRLVDVSVRLGRDFPPLAGDP